jgi:hypothetical protein
MIFEYQEMLSQVANALTSIRFELEKDGDYYAIFTNHSKWKVIFEGERFVRPAFDLQISRSEGESAAKKFSIRVLMLALGDQRVPSLRHQLEYLVENQKLLLAEGQLTYEIPYDEINRGR